MQFTVFYCSIQTHTQAVGVLHPFWAGGYLYDSIIFPQQEEAGGSQLWVLVWITICMRGYWIYKICNRWAGKHICYITVEVLGITFLLNKGKIFKMWYCCCPKLGILPLSWLVFLVLRQGFLPTGFSLLSCLPFFFFSPYLEPLLWLALNDFSLVF